MSLTSDIEVSGSIEFIPLSAKDYEFTVQNRPEYKLLTENINLKKEQIKSVRSDFLPKIGLVAGYNYIDGIRMNNHKFLKNDVFSGVKWLRKCSLKWRETPT